MTPTIRDSQRQRVYDAEAPLPHGASFPTMADVTAYIHAIGDSPWWQARFSANLRLVAITDGRRRRRASGGPGRISLPVWARTELVVLHEVAHVVGGLPWHGPKYTRVYLELVTRFMGTEAGKALRASFREHRVKVGPPLAAAPSSTARELDRADGLSERASAVRRRLEHITAIVPEVRELLVEAVELDRDLYARRGALRDRLDVERSGRAA